MQNAQITAKMESKDWTFAIPTFLLCRYMERRCRILEGCKALQLNEGIGEPIHVEGKPDRLSDIKRLRSLLFKLMEKEVLNFCDRKDTLEESHQQVNNHRLSDYI